MLIALDYDGTYTADPVLWGAFLAQAAQRGHEVVIATMRHESEPIAVDGVRVIYTGRQAKRPFLQTMGLNPSIWIDDMPDFILFGSSR